MMNSNTVITTITVALVAAWTFLAVLLIIIVIKGGPR